MAITLKGSRPIVVDGISYRWIVRSRPTYSQALGDSPLSFAVAVETAPASTLVVRMGASRPDNWMQETGVIVTPAIVERAIRSAITAGWRAHQNGKNFVLEFNAA